nr:hypothetical protein [Mycoplasmopsis bovis]
MDNSYAFFSISLSLSSSKAFESLINSLTLSYVSLYLDLITDGTILVLMLLPSLFILVMQLIVNLSSFGLSEQMPFDNLKGNIGTTSFRR